MAKCNVVKLNTKSFTSVIKNNGTSVLMLVISVAGILLGALSVKSGSFNISGNIAETFAAFIKMRSSAPFFKLLINSLLYTLPFAVAVFLSGTSIIGLVTIPMVVCYFSYSYGQLAGYLYKTYSLTGIGFTLLIIIPSRIIAILGLIFAARESITFSILMANLTLQLSVQHKAYSSFKYYCKSYIFALLIFIAAALVDCLLANCFLSFFSF